MSWEDGVRRVVPYVPGEQPKQAGIQTSVPIRPHRVCGGHLMSWTAARCGSIPIRNRGSW